MVEGDSGIIKTSPPWFRPIYESSKRLVRWPNGARAFLFSAEEPDRLRGPQCHAAWLDELASWAHCQETWDMLSFGLRLGINPRALVTTTPKPGNIVIKQLMRAERTVITRDSMHANRANLAPSFLEAIERTYKGTQLYRQEALGEIIEEAEGALWTRAMLEATRVHESPSLIRTVVAIDPAVTADADSDETGIVVAGQTAGKTDSQGYVLEDLSGRYTPDQWARKAIAAFERHRADIIVGEVNNGGDMIEHTLRTISPNIKYKAVHASKGKMARAEPYAALYQQERVHHVGGFPDLEDQLTTWEPLSGMRSPDRLDALVWALTELFPLEAPVHHQIHL
jgi:phage terminase large subunit-like protein